MPRTHFLQLILAAVELVASVFEPLTKSVASIWRRLPVHCSRCCQSVGQGGVSPGEIFAWCPHCHRIFDVPLLKIPSWVTGVLAILVLNLQHL